MLRNINLKEYFDLKNITKQELFFVLIILFFSFVIFFIPTGFEKAKDKSANQVKAEIVEVDNDRVHQIGLIRTGFQILKIKVLNGKFKGKEIDTVNHFLGKLDLDKFYKTGEKVFTVLEINNGSLSGAKVIDRYRLDISFVLVLVFILFLVLYAGWVGIKAIISFFFTFLIIWKIMLPGYLKYYDPILFALFIVAILTGGIIFLVAGFTKKGVVAFLGSFSGVFVAAILSLIFAYFFKIPGEIMPYSETLLYTGFVNLRLSKIFIAAVFIASSGAMMDIAMDVSASISELKEKNPSLSTFELIFSGFKIGRAVIGTMTTTLLLAYSGSYSTLLMIFIAQGVPFLNILNYQIIAAQILHTIVGSFGLVAVAPLTALIGGIIFNK